MMRRPSPDAPVRGGHGDAELLRLTCSLANELVEALVGAEKSRKSAVEAVTRRYARALGIGLREVHAALAPPEPGAQPPAGRAAPAAAAAGESGEPAAAAAGAAGAASAAAKSSPVPSRLRAKAGGDATPGGL
jgi:non-specific serine/threonine protein kinase